jgi:hypothetical protein
MVMLTQQTAPDNDADQASLLLRCINLRWPLVELLEWLFRWRPRLTGHTRCRLLLGASGGLASGSRRSVPWPVTARSWRAITLAITTWAGIAALFVAITIGATITLWLALATGRRAVATRRAVVRANLTVAGRHADFEFNDFIPLLVASIALGDGKEFAQTATRIKGGGDFIHRRIMTHLGVRK